MTYKNNFDTSTTGNNIELSCFYDIFQSQYDFDENFIILQHSDNQKTGKYYYIDNGTLPDSDSIEFTLKGKKSELVQYYKDNINYESISKWTKQDIIEEIIGGFETITLLNFQWFNEEEFSNYNLEFIPSKEIICLSSTGYSQGDYVEIFYSPEDMRKVWGKIPSESDMQEIFDNYIWNSPIYARFDINEKEYNYYDYDLDSYEWQREQFAQKVSKDSGIEESILLDMLPEYPSYE